MSDLLDDNTETSQAIPFRFTRLYVSLLVILSVLLTAGQIVTQWRLSKVQNEILFIRYTAIQRHQSQQIVKQALQMADAIDQAHFQTNKMQLRAVFVDFERHYLQSRAGRMSEMNITQENSDTVQQLYRAVQPEFLAFKRGVNQLLALRSMADVKTPQAKAGLTLLQNNEAPLLRKIDGIVQRYNSELRTRLHQLQTIELYLYGFTILMVLAIGLLIIRPATARLRQTIAQLIEAESRTKAANYQLRAANQSLKETRQQLFEATRQQHKREIDEQRMRTSYLITGQEEERKRLSRELHDGLGQMLTAIKLQLEGLEGLMRRQNRASVVGETGKPAVSYDRNMVNLKQLVTQTIQEVRAISNDLMPTVLSDFGVLPALKMLAESNRTNEVDITFETSCVHHMEGSLRLQKDVEIMLYRVTQEAISNALRHGRPKHIVVELVERDDYIHLIVTDDGRGFNQKAVADGCPEKEFSDRETPSQGLHNIRERAELLKGKLNITSTLGKGTRLRVSIPNQMQFARYDID
ncbi:sensor histidine kinase [Spirosoma rhododendri]|uniref:histidine kinase n=1 Tax=Spirosoma rhododendri TaxID=2728024 RepID=A0A7L5DL33_9BACT|nr:sensor histidine kinase [Spirosoma rhododendri]QJD79146.1 histidine kinase [Spirosoma rhododendri]